MLWIVDYAVEGTTREVTEKDGLAVRPLAEAVDGVCQRMVAVVGEACGKGADVDEEVRFDDDELRADNVILDVTVEQVELHALVEQLPEIAHVGAAVSLSVVAAHGAGAGFEVGGDIDIIIVPPVDDATDVPHVNPSVAVDRPARVGKDASEPRWHVGGQYGGNEYREGADVIHQLAVAQLVLAVGVAAHELYLAPVPFRHAVAPAEMVHL